MASFKDRRGREWTLEITHGDALRVKKDCKVSLYHLLDKNGAGLKQMTADPEIFVSVIYCLVQPEADKESVTPEDFGDSLAGETLDQMAEAFMEALTDFFPNAATRAATKKVAEKGKEVQQLMAARMAGAVDKIVATPAETILEQMESQESGSATTSSDPPTSLPAKSECPPTPTA